MPSRRDKVLVVDVEATCWDVKPPPDGQINEIIEIGFCFYDIASDEVKDKRSLLIKPTVSEISPFCTRLTTLTSQMIAANGIDFGTACRMLLDDYEARNYLWASWGSYDQKIFRRQCRRLGVSYPFGKRHMNLKSVFASYHGGQRRGMAGALESAGLELQGRHHRGHDDAWNIARLLQYLVRRFGLDFIRRQW